MKKTKKKRLPYASQWTFELLEIYDREIRQIAEEYQLETYPTQTEVITAEQMMDAYASVGMPINYSHWSYGKQFLNVFKNYKRGHMGLAYEIVINSNPCVLYLMEENSLTMQALVLAHAGYGHNSFFKNNYLFRTWTDAEFIIDYLVFAKKYIARCEEKYGVEKVEDIIDSCHAVMNYGVDRYKRSAKTTLYGEQQSVEDRSASLRTHVEELWRRLSEPEKAEKEEENKRFPEEPQDNLLYFIEKDAPLLETWQREIVRIVRKIAQYFYPQRQTQVMNEGWATFWHYTILNTMYDQGLVSDGFVMEFLHSHTSVIYQPPFDSKIYSGVNPYALGFGMFTDLKRICERPTQEDVEWFPDIAGSNWLETLDFAMRNFKDESFVAQFLSPKLIRDFRFFSLLDDDEEKELEVSAIHDHEGYRTIRNHLSDQYNLGVIEPNIQVFSVNIRGDRTLTLRHNQFHRKPMDKSLHEVLKHVHRLWGFSVKLETIDEKGNVDMVGENNQT